MSQIGIGIIGCGSIVDIGHCPAIRKTEGVKLVAMYDPNPEVLDMMAKKWEPEKTYTELEQILADKDIQVVIIASPNRFHCQQAIDAMRAKKHVIVEKPFACTHDEAWAMVKVCREEGVFLMAGTNQRFWEQNQIARSLMDDGYIGQPMMGRSSLHEGYSLYHDQLSYTPFRSDAHLAGAGALYDLGATGPTCSSTSWAAAPRESTRSSKRSSCRTSTPSSMTPSLSRSNLRTARPA